MYPYHQPHFQMSSQYHQPIYSYRPSTTTDKRQRTNYKIKDTSNKLKIRRILKRTDMDPIGINIYNPSTDDKTNNNIINDLESRNASFMWFHLTIEYMLELPDILNNTDDSRKDFFGVFKKYFSGNEKQLKKVNDHECDYESKNAISWYTDDFGASRILNQSLVDNNFDDIFAMRFFIRHLCDQLIEEHKYFVRNRKDPLIHLYHGQIMDINEANVIRKNVGAYISFNNFISSTENETVARFYAGIDTPIPYNKKRILFQIDIDTRLQNTKAYAKISHLSQFHDEDEVLIMLGSIFKIEQWKYVRTEHMWIFRLRMCSDNNALVLRNLTKQMQKETQAGVTSLGFVLYRQGKFGESKRYFLQLLKNKFLLSNNYNLENCFRGLGCAERGLKDYNSALLYHLRELRIVKKLNSSLVVARTYYVIAQTYLCKKYYKMALKYSLKAFILLLFDNHNDELLYVYHIMATVYREIKQFDLALIYQEKTLDIQKRLLAEKHPELGITYQNIAGIYEYMEHYQEAEHHYNKALAIFRKSCSPGHPNIKAIENKLSSLQHTTK